MDNKSKYSQLIKRWSKELGFDFVGIAKAEFLEKEAPRLEKWLQQGRQGEMHYMENYFDMRLDPTLLVPNAKSVVSFMYNYFPADQQREDAPQISKYAYGKDYHFVIKDKLKILLQKIQSEIGDVDGRAFVDSAPILERPWAAKSGLGWIGKNSLLLNKKNGSFYFLAELIIDLELEVDGPVTDHCGTCTACIDACPTDAIVDPYVVDGSKCISYFTIELKDSIPSDYTGKFENWMFGCDICQDVCPWNRFSKPHKEEQFKPDDRLLNFSKVEWEEITKEVFNEIFRKSAVKRTKFEGLKRNIEFLKT
ncbi:MAG: tRNA epoxyqueuosine(34) reductase QueG [Chitinophagales bacterium]